MSSTGIWSLFKQTIVKWWKDRASRLAASLAFYTGFSLAPLLIIIVRVAAVVFGERAARNELAEKLRGLMGETAANAVEAMIRKAAAPGSRGTLATVLSAAFFVYAATRLFTELQHSMNTIWDVKSDPHAGWWPFVRRRLFSFAMVLICGLLLLASLLISAGLAYIDRHVPGPDLLFRLISLTASVIVFTLLFATIFKLLPDARIEWRDVWIGAVCTALLFTLGRFLIGVYLAKPSISVYRAAGSVAIILIWVYYSAQVLFLGAEFTQVYARRHGRRIMPAPDAIFIPGKGYGESGEPQANSLAAADRLRSASFSRTPSAGASWLVPLGALVAGFFAGRLTKSRWRY